MTPAATETSLLRTSAAKWRSTATGTDVVGRTADQGAQRPPKTRVCARLALPICSRLALPNSRVAHSTGWSRGRPPLGEELLLAVVGDLDAIERLASHAHQVQMPAWSCICCGLSWPCEPARKELLAGLGWVRVATYCAVLMERAAQDLPTSTPWELWHRFLEWTEPPEKVRDMLINGLSDNHGCGVERARC